MAVNSCFKKEMCYFIKIKNQLYIQMECKTTGYQVQNNNICNIHKFYKTSDLIWILFSFWMYNLET